MDIRGFAPGALFYRMPFPEGVPPVESPRSHQCRALEDSSCLDKIPALEREVLASSLAKSIDRSEYHRMRYLALRAELDARRLRSPGEVFFDGFVGFLHFELQAYCGAVRLIVDELTYLAGRRHGETRNQIKTSWGASALVGDKCPTRLRAYPEVALLRREAPWFATLNTYRNAFFHHGWRHGSGHGDPKEAGSISRFPSRNALLVPDQGSIKSHSKPVDWTWAEGTTVDDVVDAVARGLERTLDELLGVCWATAVPNPGAWAEEDKPNMLVALVAPVALVQDALIILPLFSSRELARSLETRLNALGVELCKVPATDSVTGERTLSISVAGVRNVEGVERVETLDVVLDPDLTAPTLAEVTGRIRWSGTIEQVLRGANDLHPMNLPVEDEVTEVYAWRLKKDHEWPA